MNKIEEELLSAQVGDTLTFGSFPQTVDAQEEPIEWHVLHKDGGTKMLLISVFGLVARPYHETFGDITWEDCTLRAWLNNDFLNRAFTAEEQSYIACTNVKATENPFYDTNSGNDTVDKVFILDGGEAKKYFLENETFSSESKQCLPTKYASARGALNMGCSGTWWLRETGCEPYYVCFATQSIDEQYGFRFACTPSVMVRPALWVEMPHEGK
jgi:hypothetical protein